MNTANIITLIISILSLIISGISAFYTYKQTQNMETQLKTDFIQILIDNLKELKILLMEIKPESNFSGLTQKHHLDLEKIRNLLLYQRSTIEKHLSPNQQKTLFALQEEVEDVYGIIISNDIFADKKREKILNKINSLINNL
jgi:hypothetical protein